MTEISQKSFYKTPKSIMDRIIAFISTICIFTIFLLAFPAVKVNAVIPTFTNAATVEEDIKNMLQTAFDTMACNPGTRPFFDGTEPIPEVEFNIEGVELAKKFLMTEGGNIKQPFEFSPLFQELFEEQLMDIKAANYNAYIRFALTDYTINCGLSYTESSPGIVDSITLTGKYNLTWHDGNTPLAARDAVADHANAFLDSPSYTSKTNDYERIKAINTFICNTFQYDYRLFFEGPTYAIYTAYKMITDTGAIGGYKRGVCQAYTMYAYIMLKEAGFEAVSVEGTAGGGPHAWIMVKVWGNWYHIDFTWNDPISGGHPAPYVTRQDGAGTVSVNYLLRSDTEIRVNHSWNLTQNGYTYPVAASLFPTTLPTINNITQPPAPTATPTPVPTIIIVATPTNKPASVPSSKQSSAQTSSTASSAANSNASSNVSSNMNSTGQSAQSAVLTMKPSHGSSSAGQQPTTGSTAKDQNVTISGQLMDPDGNPIGSQKIELYATNQTTVTDADGNYIFRDIKPGSYKIYILEANGTYKAELPIVISYGDKTELTTSNILVKGNSLIMDLTLAGNDLSIRSVSSPKLMMTNEMIIYGVITIVLILAVILIIVLRRKRKGY